MTDSFLAKVLPGAVWAIIPARSGSKGIINKNIKEFQGNPLIAYSIAVGKLSNEIERVIVSTDSPEYANISLSYGAEVPFIRPCEFSTDTSQDIDFMLHAIKWFAENEEMIPEYWVHLRTTCPIRKPSIVDEAISSIKDTPDASSLLSVCIPEGVLTPYKWLVKDGRFIKSIFFENNDDANRPRLSYPEAYSRSIYVDIYKSSTVLKEHILFGDRILPFYTDETVDIDTQSDFAKAEKLDIPKDVREYLRMRANGNVTI